MSTTLVTLPVSRVAGSNSFYKSFFLDVSFSIIKRILVGLFYVVSQSFSFRCAVKKEEKEKAKEEEKEKEEEEKKKKKEKEKEKEEEKKEKEKKEDKIRRKLRN